MFFKNFKIYFFVIVFLFIPSVCFALNADSLYVWSNNSEAIATTTESVSTEGNFLNLTSGSGLLMEQKSGTILYEHNSHDQLRPASVTKVMSILLIMEALDNGVISLNDKVPCSEHAASMGGSQIWLETTENLTVDEMLKAICVVSANDCTVAMAEFIAGSEEMFVEQMNKKANELGMKDTCFKNSHGIDEEGHVTSSYDIALMSRELINNHPSITNYTTIWMDSLRDGESELVNTNKLVRNYSGATGLKTGSTSLALFNLSATATRDNLYLIAVIMKGETSAIRFSEAQKLLDYGFSNFQYIECNKKGDLLKSISVDKGTSEYLNVIFESDSGALVSKGKSKDIVTNVNLNEKVSAPISKGQKLGEITYSIENEVISTVNLIAETDVKKLNLTNMMAHIFENWFSLLR